MRTLIAAIIGITALPAFAQSADDGEKLFRRCTSCHQIGEGAKNRTGPVLNGIVGSPAAAVEGFGYSDSLTAAAEAGLVWDAETLDAWLADATGFLRTYLDDPKARSKMSFKVKEESDRAAMIAYLETF